MAQKAFFLTAAALLIVSGCSSAKDVRTPKQSGYSVNEGAVGQKNGAGIAQYATQWNGAANGNAGQMSDGMTAGIRQSGLDQPTGSKTGVTTSNWPGAISDSDTGIQVLSVATPVRQGDKGSLVIRGVPDTAYRVTAVYYNSQGTMTAASDKLSDRDGIAAWVWNVKPDTLPGTYRLVVSGGGKMIGTSYMVTK